MDRKSYLKGVVRNDPSKLRYFKKDYNTYKITYSEDDKKVKEYYEVKYLLYRIPLAQIGYLGDKSPISLACIVLLFSWIFLILFILGIGLSIGLDSTCNNSTCSNVTCTIRNQTALDYGLIDEWTLDNTLNDSVRCNDLTAFPGASFNKISNSPRIFAGYLQPNGYYAAPPDVYFSGGDFTITSYVYVMSVQNWARIIDFGIVQADSVFLSTSAGNTGEPIVRIFNSNTMGGLVTQSPTAIPLFTWTHVAAILRGTTLSLYMNTNLVRSETVSVLPRNVVRLNNFIGRSNWVADSYANAKYRNIRIYNRALSAAELLVDFNDQ